MTGRGALPCACYRARLSLEMVVVDVWEGGFPHTVALSSCVAKALVSTVVTPWAGEEVPLPTHAPSLWVPDRMIRMRQEGSHRYWTAVAQQVKSDSSTGRGKINDQCRPSRQQQRQSGRGQTHSATGNKNNNNYGLNPRDIKHIKHRQGQPTTANNINNRGKTPTTVNTQKIT